MDSDIIPVIIWVWTQSWTRSKLAYSHIIQWHAEVWGPSRKLNSEICISLLRFNLLTHYKDDENFLHDDATHYVQEKWFLVDEDVQLLEDRLTHNIIELLSWELNKKCSKENHTISKKNRKECPMRKSEPFSIQCHVKLKQLFMPR